MDDKEVSQFTGKRTKVRYIPVRVLVFTHLILRFERDIAGNISVLQIPAQSYSYSIPFFLLPTYVGPTVAGSRAPKLPSVLAMFR